MSCEMEFDQGSMFMCVRYQFDVLPINKRVLLVLYFQSPDKN